MRNKSLSLAVSVVLGALLALGAACGPSGKQVATAKQARYQGDKLQIFAVAKRVTESRYRIQRSDETALGLQTEGRWYNPEGQAISANIGDIRDVPDRSLNIALVVEVLQEGANYVVAVRPVMMRYIQGRPNPDMLEPTDPSIPGWALGKGDNLQVEIYNALRQFQVAAPAAGSSAAPSPAAPPAGAEPAPPAGTEPAPAPAPPAPTP